MENTTRTQKKYDHRLKDLVRSTKDITCAVRRGVPRSTARGWLRAPATEVISIDVVQLDVIGLQKKILQLEARLRKLNALLRVVIAVLKLSGYSLNHERVPDGKQKCHLLRAIERSRPSLPLRSVLRVIRLSQPRYHAWNRKEQCELSALKVARTAPCGFRQPAPLTDSLRVGISHPQPGASQASMCDNRGWNRLYTGPRIAKHKTVLSDVSSVPLSPLCETCAHGYKTKVGGPLQWAVVVRKPFKRLRTTL